MMRLIFAGLFVFGLQLVLVAIIGALFGDQDWPEWLPFIFPAFLFLSIFLVYFIFNKPGQRHAFLTRSLEDVISELETAQLITRQQFHATRAFQLEEFEDEGLHYFVELENQTVLYLTGQYLYDYEMIDDDPELNQPRSFPCTDFTILRHKTEGHVIKIDCNGTVLEPEALTPSFTKSELRSGAFPEDGDILQVSYDELKKHRMKS